MENYRQDLVNEPCWEVLPSFLFVCFLYWLFLSAQVPLTLGVPQGQSSYRYLIYSPSLVSDYLSALVQVTFSF